MEMAAVPELHQGEPDNAAYLSLEHGLRGNLFEEVAEPFVYSGLRHISIIHDDILAR